MDWSAAVEAASLVFALIGAVISLWVRSTIDQRVETALDAQHIDVIVPMQKQIGINKEKIAELTARCDALATREDFHKLALQIERALGEMKATGATVNDMRDTQKAMQASVQRVNDYLLNEKVTS